MPAQPVDISIVGETECMRSGGHLREGAHSQPSRLSVMMASYCRHRVFPHLDVNFAAETLTEGGLLAALLQVIRLLIFLSKACHNYVYRM